MPALDLIAAARNDQFAARVMMVAYKVAQNVASEDPGTATMGSARLMPSGSFAAMTTRSRLLRM